jgi:hypothetical protein
MHVNNYKP